MNGIDDSTNGPGLERVLVLRGCARDRGGGDRRRATARAGRREGGRQGRRRRHAQGARATSTSGARVVIGEGERDEAPMLYIGEKVGIGDGPEVDIAVDPLEGTTICAKAMPNALAVLAIAERGGLLNAPDMYMNKIAIGPGYPDGIIDLDAPPVENAHGDGQGQGRADLRDHGLHPRPAAPRGADQGRARAGAGVQLIPDGDIAGVIWTTGSARPASTSTSVRAARRRACWPPRLSAALAGKCRAG